MKMDANGIVWKQNIHLGDARATDWILEGSIDLGHWVREQLPSPGTEVVGSGWGAPLAIGMFPMQERDHGNITGTKRERGAR